MQEAQGVGTGGAAAARRAHGEQVIVRVLRRLGAVAPDLAEQHGRRRQVAAVGTRGDRVVKCCELRALAAPRAFSFVSIRATIASAASRSPAREHAAIASAYTCGG